MVTSVQISCKCLQSMKNLSSAVVILLSIAGVAYPRPTPPCNNALVNNIAHNILTPYYNLYFYENEDPGQSGHLSCFSVSIHYESTLAMRNNEVYNCELFPGHKFLLEVILPNHFLYFLCFPQEYNNSTSVYQVHNFTLYSYNFSAEVLLDFVKILYNHYGRGFNDTFRNMLKKHLCLNFNETRQPVVSSLVHMHFYMLVLN